jgi:membrane-associated phospholipid phosphatase
MHVSSLAGLLVATSLATASAADLAGRTAAPVPSPDPWLVEAASDFEVQALETDATSELAEVRALVGARSPADTERILWWDVGGPAYRWNEIAVDAMLDGFVTSLAAGRGLALMHAAIDDAVAAAWAAKQTTARPRPSQADPAIVTAIAVPEGPSYPSDFAAAATAAAQVLGYLMPEHADAFAAKAEEAMQTRVLAGVEYPSDLAAGRAIGEQAAALAIERARTDGSDSEWTGHVPVGPGKWQGTDPVGPLAGTWRSWVLSRPDEFRPAPPPPFDSAAVATALNELRTYERTPASNHKAVYWEVFGGGRDFALWNEMARTKLLEYGPAFGPLASARALAALNVAHVDATIACFDAKYAYWYIRPSQLDPELTTVFPPPNHPSYPAAHACLSTARATVLAHLFPRDRDRLLARAKEAGESRIWAGIHYRFDIEAGETLGRQVAEKVLERAFAGPAE